MNPHVNAVVAAAWLAAGVSALLSPSSPLTTTTRSSSTSFGARRPPRLPARSGPLASRKSSPREGTLEAETSSSAGTGSESDERLVVFDDPAAATAASSGAGEGGDRGEPSESGIPRHERDRDRLRRVLSSPDLLDPAAVLDATIGIAGGNGADADSMAAAGDAVATAALTLAAADGADFTAAPAGSNEDDLKLTLRAIVDRVEAEEDEEGVGGDERDEEEENSLKLEESEPRLQPQPTAAEGGKSTLSSVGAAPSVSKILRYTVPAVGIWLCSPVLSMIDTAAVGLLGGTAQQAALNPAVSVTDYGALLVAFMYTATTNLIAAAAREDEEDVLLAGGRATSRQRTTATLIVALKLALLVGSAFGVALFACGRTLLRFLIGNDALDPLVFGAALRYVRIRALGMPATVVIGTAQSACLGMRDVKSPLYVLLAAAVVNFLGDVLLVPRAGSRMFGGAAGAAWATVASQYAAILFFGRWLTFAENKVTSGDDANNDDAGVVNVTQGIMELTGTSKAGRSRRKEFLKFLASSRLSKRIRRAGRETAEYESTQGGPHPSNDTMMTSLTKDKIRSKDEKRQPSMPATKGFLSGGKLTPLNFLSFSDADFDRSKAGEFLPFVVPVTTTSVGRISGYVAMSHVASSALGTYDMAAHQIVFSVFCCLTPLVDALNQVAQSLVPAARAEALRETVRNFRRVGAGFSALLLGPVACVPLIGRCFTTDPVVLERVVGAMPGLGLFLFMHGLVCVGEGTLLGQKDLKFLRNMYAIFFFTVPAYMLRLKQRALTGAQTVGIGTMWAAFSVYNLIRTSAWHLRLAQLQRRRERGMAAVLDGAEEECR